MSQENVGFDKIYAATKNPDYLIIDVREPSELEETGKIPSSINIPLGELVTVLTQLPSEEFKTRFGVDKPSEDTPIIFSCKLGGRGAKAQEMAQRLGYKNTKNFAGGWMEWEKKMNEIKQ